MRFLKLFFEALICSRTFRSNRSKFADGFSIAFFAFDVERLALIHREIQR